MDLFKYQAAVLMVLFNNESPVNASVISTIINTSLKTVKKEIDDLNYLCKDNGCEIVSQPGSGYMFEVFDRNKYELFHDTIRGMYNKNLFYYDSQNERVHYIIRQFLIRNNISMIALADECNCSESSLRRDIAQVKAILNKFKLTLVNRTNKGTSLEGDEWHIRLALLHERFLYLFNSRVYFKNNDTEFEKMFLAHDGTNKELKDLVERILVDSNYNLSYDALLRFTVMISLVFTRIKETSRLAVTTELNKANIETEREIIDKIFCNFAYFGNTEISYEEKVYLSIFLKSIRMQYYSQFLQCEESAEIRNQVNEFIDIIRSTYDITVADTTTLFKDLCVGFYSLKYGAMLDSHTIRSHVYQQLNDGLLNLDICALLYTYLHDRLKMNVTSDDISVLYHVFEYFTYKCHEVYKKKILVVSDTGFFNARTQAHSLNQRNSNQFVEYIPMNYIEFKLTDMTKYDGILSDIPHIHEQFPNMKHAYLSLFRSRSRVSDLSQFFVLSISDLGQIFTPDDLYYTDSIKCEEDIYKYIYKILQETDGKVAQHFIKEVSEKNNIYSNIRNNNCYVFNSFHDFFGKSFIKIICLKEAILINREYVNKIIVYNAKGNKIFDRAVLASKVGMVLHNYNTLITFDREKDYLHLLQIINR